MHHQSSASARGVSLIEVLVALVVLSIGLLSLAALQASAVRHALGSFQLSVAKLHVLDAAERLWASRCVVLDSHVLDTLKADWQATHALQPGQPTLPGWQGDIARVSSTGDPVGTYLVAVQWADKPTRPGSQSPSRQLSQTVSIPHHSC